MKSQNPTSIMKQCGGVGAIAFLLLTPACGARVVEFGDAPLAIGGTTHGELTTSDASMNIPGRPSPHRADVYFVSLTAGEPVTLTMCEDAGADLDPYLTVDINGLDVQSNDDSAGGYHGHGSLITFTPSMTGMYQIIASTFRSVGSGDTGAYTLQVLAGSVNTFRCPGA